MNNTTYLKSLLMAFALFVSAMPIYAQQDTKMAIEDCIDYAIKNRNSIKNARFDEAIGKAKNDEVKGLAFPKISVDGKYQEFGNIPQSFIPGAFFGQPGGFVAVEFTPKYGNTLSSSISQILFDGSVAVALEARKTLVGLYEINTKRSIEQVRMDVSKAYYNVQIAQERLVLLAQTTDNIKKLKNDVEAMYKSGLVEKLDVDRMAVTYNNIETEKIKLTNFVELSMQLLKFQMGMPMQQKLAIQKVDEASIKQLSASIDKANFQYENRLDYNLVSTQLNLNKLDAKRYKWAAMPTIVAFGNAGYNYSTSEFKNLFGSKYIFSSLWGIQASMPLFDGLQRRNKLKQAEFAKEKTKNDLATLSQAIDLEQEQASTNLKNNFLALESQKTNVNLAQSVFDLSKKKYEAGVGSNTEVIQAESSLREAQSNYYGALLNVFIAKIDLQKSLGLLK